MSYKISVIVPVYNASKYLRKSLDSIVAQTIGIENIEVIIVNDASTDDSLAIINEYVAKYPSFKLINNEVNRGSAISRNKALNHVSSDYLTFLDADDFLDVNIFKDALKQMSEDGSDLLIYNWFLYLNDRIIDEKSIHQPNIVNNAILSDFLEKPDMIFSTSLCNRIFHKNLFRYITFPDILYDDNKIAVETLINAEKISLNKDLNYYYRKNQESVTKEITLKNPLELAKSIKSLTEILDEYEDYADYIKLLIIKFSDDILFWLYYYKWYPKEEIAIIEALKDSIPEINKEDIDLYENISGSKLLYSEDILNLVQSDVVTFIAKYKYYLKSPVVNPIASLYVDCGNGFNEINKVNFSYNLDKVNVVKFDLIGFKNIKSLRFDPISNVFSKVMIMDISNNIKLTDNNSYESIDDYDIFITNDPNYILKGDFNDLNSLEINFKLDILDNEELQKLFKKPQKENKRTLLRKLKG